MSNEITSIAEVSKEKKSIRAAFSRVEYQADSLRWAKDKADDAIRINYNEVSEENKKLIDSFKSAIAGLHVDMSLIEDKVNWGNRESVEEAKKHLQLASYYIVHALTGK